MEERLILRNLIFLLLNTIILTQCIKYIINEKDVSLSGFLLACTFIHYIKTFQKLIIIDIYFLRLLFLRGSLVGFLQLSATIIYTFAARKTDASACHQPFWIFFSRFTTYRKSRSSNLLDFFNVSIELSHLTIII